jgi:hypothetical protein
VGDLWRLDRRCGQIGNPRRVLAVLTAAILGRRPLKPETDKIFRLEWDFSIRVVNENAGLRKQLRQLI